MEQQEVKQTEQSKYQVRHDRGALLSDENIDYIFENLEIGYDFFRYRY